MKDIADIICDLRWAKYFLQELSNKSKTLQRKKDCFIHGMAIDDAIQALESLHGYREYLGETNNEAT